ncbi:response regulator [bacterium]|nr:response regulator [bacterium]
MPGERLLTTGDAAKYCRVDRRTILRWVTAGRLPGHKTGGGRTRIREQDLIDFMSECGIPMPRVTALLARNTPRVGIVDDDPRVVRALAKLIARRFPGVEIRTAGDGFGAGIMATTFQPHLLILDIVMPGLDGEDACRLIRSNEAMRDIAIFVLSGHLDEDRRERLIRAGVDRVVEKPVESAVLYEAVATLAVARAGPAPVSEAAAPPFTGRRS